MEEQRVKEKSNNKILMTIAIIILGIIMIITAIMGIRMAQDSNDNEKTSGGLEMGVIDAKDDEAFKKKVQDSLNAQVDAGMVGIFMNTSIQLETSESEANLLIQNGENNNFSQQVDIYHGEDLIYSSPIIEPGYKIENDYLEKELDAGTYECMAHITILDSETEDQVNKVGLPVVIVIKN